MLILYMLLFLFASVLYIVIRLASEVAYYVKISLLLDSIQSKNDLLYLNIKDYESVIAEVFRRNSYRVRLSDHFGEGGRGIILNDLYYVQAKKESYHHLVDIEQAMKLTKHMRDNNIHRGMIITLGDFKQCTKKFCHMYVITCINGDQLLKMCLDAQKVGYASIFERYL